MRMRLSLPPNSLFLCKTQPSIFLHHRRSLAPSTSLSILSCLIVIQISPQFPPLLLDLFPSISSLVTLSRVSKSRAAQLQKLGILVLRSGLLSIPHSRRRKIVDQMSLCGDLASRIYPEPYAAPDKSADDSAAGFDHFDRLPDSILLLVFNKIGDVKALGRCCVVSRRFHSLVPQVENVVVRVDCVISDDDSSSASSSSDKSRSPFVNLFRVVFTNIFKPLQALGQFLGPKRSSLSSSSSPSPSATALTVGSGGGGDEEADQGGVTHHSPTQVLKNFSEIRFLRIELPSGELGIDDGVLLKWRADFGSTLDNCVILGASSFTQLSKQTQVSEIGVNGDLIHPIIGANGVLDDNGSIPESFYTNGGLKLRVVWTISSLIAASARHYLLQPIIAEHKTLDSLVLTDADGQGVLCMNRDQLEELRVKPLSASSASKRTMVPALNMRLWYAPQLELPGGLLLKGATLVAIRPSEQSGVAPSKKEISDLSWVASAFEEPYGTAAKMLVKRRTYCLEMNSF